MADTKISGATPLTGTGLVSRPAARAGATTAYRTVDNFEATTDPGVGDDSADGFHVGSTWFRKDTGQFWRCRDASVGAAVWIRVAIEGFRTYIVGNFYTPLLSGAPVAGATSQNNGNIKAFYGLIPQRVTISELAAAVGTTNAGNFQCAIYKNKVGGFQPGVLVGRTPSATMASAVAVSTAITGGDKTLEPGGYWFCTNSDNSAGILVANQAPPTMPQYRGAAAAANILVAANAINGLSTAAVFDTWDADHSSTVWTESTTSGRTPLVAFKVSAVPL